MAPWVRLLEAYLVQLLLRTPAFHRGVEKVARSIYRLRHGIPPEEMGGTKIDQPGNSSFLKHFNEEIQTQLGRAERKVGQEGGVVKKESSAPKAPGAVEEAEEESAKAVWRNARRNVEEAEEESAEAVWRNARRNVEEGQKEKQGFMGEYIGALREQLRNGGRK